MTTAPCADPAALGTVLITGAGGFLGRRVTELFCAAGARVRAADRPGVDLEWARALGGECAALDLLRPATLIPALAGAEVAVHCAAIFDFGARYEALMAANVGGTRALCAAAERTGLRRLVLLSSVGVYGAPAVCPCPEEGPKRPRNPYERSKWRQERAAFAGAERGGFEVAALRPTLVYGPRGRYGLAVLTAALCAARAGGLRYWPALAGGPQTHHVHVDDVARACLLLASHPNAAGRSFNCVDQTPMPAGELWRLLLDAAGLPPKRPALAGRAVQVAARAAAMLPLAHLTGPGNRFLALQWRRLVRAGRIVGELRPRLDADWRGYMEGDNVYDWSALEALGFTWRHPRFPDGWAETVAWYRRARWLPGDGDR